MIDDDGYDGIRSHGVDPDWNPFSTPRDDDPDDIGWDDGSETPHANPSRMSRKGVAVLTACTASSSRSRASAWSSRNHG